MAVALLLLVTGYLIVNAVLGRRDIDPVIRAGLALPAILAAALLLMLAHIVSGGRLFAHPTSVRIVTVMGIVGLAILILWRRRRYSGSWSRPAALALGGVVVLAVFIWGRAVFELFPAGRSGDSTLHAGWASSLMNGERLPTNGLSGEIPNDYPWMFHALLGWLTALTPGGRAFHALGPLQIVQVAGTAATLFALGYALWRRWAAGLTTTLFGMLAGGFGFLAANPRLIYEVRGKGSAVGLTFGDLMARRSFNFAFHNLAPAHPREITYALFLALLLLFLLAVTKRDRNYLIAFGCVLGIIGLTGGEAFIAGGVMMLVFVALAGDLGRVRAALYMGVPAAVLFSLWFVPLMMNYFKYDGFVPLISLPVTLTPLQVLGGWGVVTPFSFLGLVLLMMRVRADAGARMILATLAILVALLLIATVLGSGVRGGFETLGLAHRYWPMVFLAIAICAGYGLFWIVERLAGIHILIAVVVMLAVSAAALASPLIGTTDFERALVASRGERDPTVGQTLTGNELTWLAVLSPDLGDRCTVAVPENLSVESYAYSGYRHVMFGRAKGRNTARIRWKNIYEEIGLQSMRRSVNQVLVTASTSSERFRELIDRYGVDRVLVYGTVVESPALEGFRIQGARGWDSNYAVVYTGECGD